MIVVSDTTAITSLLKLDRAELLDELFDEVVVPVAVQEELRSYHGAIPVWLKVQAVLDTEVLAMLQSERLDAGEAEAIALTRQIDADLLIVDEKRGRRVAAANGLRCIGLVGVLLLAKERGLVDSLRPLLDQLESRANFFLHESVRNRLLASAGEA